MPLILSSKTSEVKTFFSQKAKIEEIDVILKPKGQLKWCGEFCSDSRDDQTSNLTTVRGKSWRFTGCVKKKAAEYYLKRKRQEACMRQTRDGKMIKTGILCETYVEDYVKGSRP